MNRKLLLQLFALVACLLCSMSAAAAEAYACFTESNHTLTFYYDNLRSSRSGTTYDLNTGESEPDWLYYSEYVTQVVFNSSFANFRPSTTRQWFWGMRNLTSISGINYLNTSNVTDMYGMFLECIRLESLDLSTFNTSKVTNMCSMFYVCMSLKSLNLSTFNTSNVTNMGTMFYGLSLTSLDLSSFNTSKVIYMGSMFSGCSGLTSLNLSNFNTANVTDMGLMFAWCEGLTSIDLGSFSTGNVKDMECMFEDCSNLRTIFAGSGWSTAGVADSTDMFLNCTKLVGGKGTTYSSSHIDKAYAHIDGGTSNPGYFTAAGTEAYACYTPSNTTLTFYYDNLRSSRSGTTYDMNAIWEWPGWRNDGTCSSVTKVVFNSSFADARPISTCYWFNYMQNLQSITGLSYLNTSEVTDMTYMFAGSKKLTSLDVSNFNTSKVTLMRGMFSGCTGLTSLDLSNFNTSRVTDMEYMFNNCTNLRTIYAGTGWSTAAVTSSDGMFTFCTSLVGGKGTTFDANHTNKAYAHIDGGPSNPGYLSNIVPGPYACYTTADKTLTFYFDNQRNTRQGTTYDLNTGSADTGWDSDGTKSDVTKVVFDPSFAGARPTTTYDWFYLMRNLQSISGISYLNTSEVTNMAHMFNNCTKLTSLDLSGFNTSKVTDMHCMFYKCSALQTIYVGSGWSTAAVIASANMFSNCTSLVGGKGTTYDANYIDKTWARIDGGMSRPGYFTDKNAVLRGDVNGDGEVTIADINALINMILSNDSNNVGDVNGDGEVGIADINTLIDIILNS